MKRELVVGTIILASASGCSLSGKLPLNHFDSPENGGAEESTVRMALSPADMMSEVIVVPDTTATPPDASHREPRTRISLSGAAMVSPPGWERFEFGAALRINGPGELRARYRLVGQRAPLAEAGNFSASIVLRGGLDGSSGSDSSTSIFGGPTVNADHSDSTPYFDANFPIGYRISKSFLVYTGPFYSYGLFKGHIAQSFSNGGSATYDPTAYLRQWGLTFGLQTRAGRTQWRVEIAGASFPRGFSPGELVTAGLCADFAI